MSRSIAQTRRTRFICPHNLRVGLIRSVGFLLAGSVATGIAAYIWTDQVEAIS